MAGPAGRHVLGAVVSGAIYCDIMKSLLLPSRVEYGSSGGVVAVRGGDDWAWVMGIADWICCAGNVPWADDDATGGPCPGELIFQILTGMTQWRVYPRRYE
jgi:hypothetical protein